VGLRVRKLNTSETVTRRFLHRGHPARDRWPRNRAGAAVVHVRLSLSRRLAGAQQFASRAFPLSERVSDLFLRYELFTPRYRTFRDLDTFDFREDIRLGPYLSLKPARLARG